MNFGFRFGFNNLIGLFGSLNVGFTQNGTFDNNIDGYVARANSVISHDAIEQALLCNVTGTGGGFISDLTKPTVTSQTYRISIDAKNKTYGGGFKVRLGYEEVVLIPVVTSEWATYTIDITALGALSYTELFRSGTDTGEVLLDNFSIIEL